VKKLLYTLKFNINSSSFKFLKVVHAMRMFESKIKEKEKIPELKMDIETEEILARIRRKVKR